MASNNHCSISLSIKLDEFGSRFWTMALHASYLVVLEHIRPCGGRGCLKSTAISSVLCCSSPVSIETRSPTRSERTEAPPCVSGGNGALTGSTSPPFAVLVVHSLLNQFPCKLDLLAIFQLYHLFINMYSRYRAKQAICLEWAYIHV